MRQLKINKSITAREGEAFEKYLQEIGRENLITVEEEVELTQRIRKGDRAALDKLVLANLRFVVSVAKQYQNQGLTLPDLISEGNIGLIKAAEKFDETRGFKFISYAVWWIRQTILQALAEQSRLVRLPLNQVSAVNKISKAIIKFEQEHERKPSTEELADIVNEMPGKIDDSLRASGRHVSMDAPFVAGEDNTLLDVMSDSNAPTTDRAMMSESLSTEIERALNTLNGREKEIIEMSYGINHQEMTLEEIGEKFGLTRERVRQIREKAIRKLRCTERNSQLRGYLGEELNIINLEHASCSYTIKTVDLDISKLSKGGFDHYMLKEIYDQPNCLKDCMSGRLIVDKEHPENNHIVLSALRDYRDRLVNAKHIIIVACENEEKIKECYELAEQIKKDFHGNRIVMFAPLYLSNYCVNGCVYCPYHMKNKHIARKKLTQEEIVKEVTALQDMGHKRLAIEAGEDIHLYFQNLTADEREILADGCLMNFYAAQNKK